MSSVLAVGQSWQGTSMSAFPAVMAQPSPPKVKPAFVSQNGVEYLKLVLPAGAERIQPQSAGLLALNGCYQMTVTTLINQADIVVPAGDWFALFQLWGAPFKGSPNVQLQVDSAGNIGPREANGVWLKKIPITYGTPMDWEIDLKWATSGPLTVKCNGTVIYSNPNYAAVTSADITGPWSFEPHLYTKAIGLPTQAQCLYTNMSVTRVQSLTPTPTPPPPPPPSPGPSGSPVPLGVPGNWTLVFDDEFNGTTVDTTTWDEHNGWANQNNVTDHASNVTETGGNLILKLVSNTSGAAVAADGFGFGVGEYIEARICFPATSSGRIAGWPAWWTSGPNWPAAGENDIAEGLGGQLTVNYHSPTGAHNMGAIPGNWADGNFHTYGLYRHANGCDVYWDGKLVKSYGTNDNGQPQTPILTIGFAGGTFAPAQMLVDYVRAWA